LAALAAGHAASLKMDSIVADSAIFDGSPPKFPRTVRAEDLILGDKLGEGGFCFVYACAFKEAPLDESCAVKYLRPQIACQKKTFEHGAADLATEAFFLTKLDHPSIIKLRAVAAGSVESNVCSGKETGFFLVVDRLVETLDQRLQRWKDQMFEIPHTLFYRMSKEYKDKQKEFLKERLKVAVDIASVMSYLQSLNVAYRDLKPDNVGFDREGNLKLFDFGLCKEEKPTIASTEGRYCMTGHTGSRRYMAPEGMLVVLQV
jgi:serine/threonine protein kinase